ncbi:3-deoxy-D-manno-octulosonic acid transferase [Flagellimonas aquimarina]|uniref:3-deoxy-D-manno-octulosonic acid transferase n=2 Tax=Flagellimonas aquimarina TaxID=2201895 RepID=A0A316L505_9FLAO|nr:3-deoxy-D-manno-octulosonic acid transferase [Allomuricauda koreensis]
MFVRFVYNFLISISWIVIKVIALFNTKMKLFVSGRKGIFQQLNLKISKNDRFIWMHVASLGEYEQGLPILEKTKLNYPSHKIILTFFSPSGYEVKKNTPIADIVIYLPMDTKSNVKRFLDMVKPELAIFIKYEIWPNYLYGLKQRNIPVILVSAIFSNRQIFFKPFGGFMRNGLKAFAHFFVQDKKSKDLLSSIGFENITVGGDTRFDRVSEILKQNNHLDFMNEFKNDGLCLVAGSTWPEDEEILADWINSTNEQIKCVIAPHTIKETHVQKLKTNISKKTVCFSKIEGEVLSTFDVIIIDNIGLLTKIYSYADIAYVGGAFETGLHNTLEPAVNGIPVVIGPNYSGFKEAEDLVSKKGIYVVTSKEEFKELMARLIDDGDFRERTGKINSKYINKNIGATAQVIAYIKTIL